jgi:hypothetical protein
MSPTTTLAGLVTLAAAAPLAVWFAARRYEEVPVHARPESTPEHFHATPSSRPRTSTRATRAGAQRAVAHRARRGAHRRDPATVGHASAPRRWWTRMIGVSEISSLYEVGFEG